MFDKTPEAIGEGAKISHHRMAHFILWEFQRGEASMDVGSFGFRYMRYCADSKSPLFADMLSDVHAAAEWLVENNVPHYYLFSAMNLNYASTYRIYLMMPQKHATIFRLFHPEIKLASTTS